MYEHHHPLIADLYQGRLALSERISLLGRHPGHPRLDRVCLSLAVYDTMSPRGGPLEVEAQYGPAETCEEVVCLRGGGGVDNTGAAGGEGPVGKDWEIGQARVERYGIWEWGD